MWHPVCRLHSMVLGRSTALGVRSPIPARALLPLLLLLAPAFSSVKWAWDEMVPELLSRADNGILYGFQGGEWPQMHPLHADGALSLVSMTSSALFLQCCLSRPFSEPKERGRRKLKQAISQPCTVRLTETTCPKDEGGPLESDKCCVLSWVTLVLWEADVPVEVEVQRIYWRQHL